MNSPMNPPMNNEKRLVVFTDLDGCLLDHDSYSFAPAAEALAVLAAQGIPLVLCSSKTRAEIEMLQQDLGVAHPFVSENGGALFLPSSPCLNRPFGRPLFQAAQVESKP